MKTFFALLTIGLTVAVSSPTLADFPVRQSTNWDAGCVIAYNSTSNQYLVVWQELIPFGQFYLFGPVMGQLHAESGAAVGSAFQIFSIGTLPSVAYNSQTNEYLVVVSWNGLQGQRLSNTGTLVGGSVLLMSEGAWPRILYNPLAANYLLVHCYLNLLMS